MHVRNDLVELTAWVVSSFVAHNSVAPTEVPKLINSTHNALLALNPARAAGLTRVPAVPPEKSITRDYIICLDDGRRLKTLKAHIRRKYSLSPDEYRARWQLPEDYPMVAPAYAELRSAIARRELTAAGDAESARRRWTRDLGENVEIPRPNDASNAVS